MKNGYSSEEWQVRVDLAACYRLVDHYGMSDLVGTHIAAKVPGEDAFLLNPYGLFFDEITASSLIKVNYDGEAVSESEHEFNKAGFTIHSAVLGARDDVVCSLHTHTVAGMAVSVMECGLLSITQHAINLHGRLSYHDYEGAATNLDERERLARDLGENNLAMILRNHGLLACGRTVAEAFRIIFYLEKSCAAQLAAMSATDRLVMPSDAAVDRTAQLLQERGTLMADRAWPGHLRRLDRLDPSYKN